MSSHVIPTFPANATVAPADVFDALKVAIKPSEYIQVDLDNTSKTVTIILKPHGESHSAGG